MLAKIGVVSEERRHAEVCNDHQRIVRWIQILELLPPPRLFAFVDDESFVVFFFQLPFHILLDHSFPQRRHRQDSCSCCYCFY